MNASIRNATNELHPYVWTCAHMADPARGVAGELADGGAWMPRTADRVRVGPAQVVIYLEVPSRPRRLRDGCRR